MLIVLTLIFIPVTSPSSDYSYLLHSHLSSNVPLNPHSLTHALDMSTAFDTLDHITLLYRLQHTFGSSLGFVHI